MTTVAERVPSIRIGSHALRTELLSPLLRKRHQQRTIGGAPPPERSFGHSLRQTLLDTVGALTAHLSFGKRPATPNRAVDQVPFILNNLEQLEWLYDRLADDHSRSVLVDVLRAQALGLAYVPPPEHAARYRRRQQSMQRELEAERTGARPWPPSLGQYCLRGPNGNVRMHAHEQHVLHTFLLERYAYLHGPTTIRTQPGDVVIDGGSRWGDAALYFADLVGSSGQVYALEHSPANAAVIAQNLTLNPRLLSRVRILEAALSDRAGERVSYQAHGPVTTPVRVDPWGRLLVDTTTSTIDDIVEREKLRRVDFVRLDLDGTELQALIGARKTVLTHRPTLAVSLYHRHEDIVTIPAYLDDVAPDFDFFLDDVTLHGKGVILFARPRPDLHGDWGRTPSTEHADRAHTDALETPRRTSQGR